MMQTFDFRRIASARRLRPSLAVSPWRRIPAQLLHVDKGSLQIEFPMRGRESVTVSAGQVHLLPADESHRYRDVGTDTCASWVQFSALLNGVPLTRLIELEAVYTGDRAAKLRRELGRVHSASRTGVGLAGLSRVQQAGFAMLSRLLEVQKRQPLLRRDSVERAARLEAALAAWHRHPDRAWTVEQSAALCQLRRSRFHELFVECFGCSPRRHLRHIRIGIAQRLLTETTESIATIGAMCGFPDPYHFSRAFRTDVGVSPLGFRKRDGLL